MFFSMQILMASAARSHSRILAGDSAGFEDEPGRDKPIASMAVDIACNLLAVILGYFSRSPKTNI